MSWLRRVFGTRDRAPSTSEATAKLDEILELMEKKTAHLEAQIDEQMQIARSNAKTDKRVALKALARKRRCEKELNGLDSQTSTLELQREALAGARIQGEMVEAMRAAGRALEAAQQHLGIEEVEAIQDQIEDQLQISEEIRTALSRPFYDDQDEIMEEFEKMEQELLDDELATVDPLPVSQHKDSPRAEPSAGMSTGTGLHHMARLPSVPDTEPQAARSKSKGISDTDELADLQNWAAAT